MDEFNINFVLTWYDILLQKFEFRPAVQVSVLKLKANLFWNKLIHESRFESIGMFTQQTEEARYNLLHLLVTVPYAWMAHMLVSTYVLRKRMRLLFEEWTFLGLKIVLRSVVSPFLIVFGVDEVSKGMVDILQFDLDFIIHGFQEIFELREAKFIQI